MKHSFLFLLLLHCLHLHLGDVVSWNQGVALGAYPLSRVPTHGVYPAKILASYGQLLTSSTLNWVDVSLVQSGKIAAERVIVSGDSAVCRCRFGHKLEPGRTDLSGHCIVRGAKNREYQILVDMYGMTRVNWKKWNMFSDPALGTVAFNDNTFVGLMIPSQGSLKRISELDYNKGLYGELSLQLSEDEIKSDTKGWALVETEPIKYTLENVVIVAEKIVSKETIKLGSVYLERRNTSEKEDWLVVSERLDYNWRGYEYFGNIGGTVRGLPASAHLNHSDTKYFKWGLHLSPNHSDTHYVSYSLQDNTSANVSVIGVKARVDMVYECTLHTVYRDGSLSVHNMTSIWTRDSIVNITNAVSGPIYLDSGLPAPMTTTTTTTTQSTSASQATETTTQPPHARMFVAPTPTPTLFPPAPPPVTRPNPLKMFYPDSQDSETEGNQGDIVRVDILPLSGALINRIYYSNYLFPLLIMFLLKLL